MEEKILAAIIADRSGFDRIDSHLSQEDVSPEGAVILKEIRKFYYKDAAADCADIEIITKMVLRRLQNPKHADVFKTYLNRVKQAKVSGINVVSEVLAAKREALDLSLAEAITLKDERRVDDLIEARASLRMDADLDGDVHEEYQGLDTEALLKTFERDNLIRVGPPSLNRRMNGGVVRGSHIVVVAYPETGKTLVTMTMAVGFVGQGLKVLYVGNEDPIKSVVLRFISALTGRTAQRVASDPKAAMKAAVSRGYDRAVFAGLSGGSLEDLRGLLNKHKPDVLIVDQIRNISTKSENRTLQLESVARAMRNFAREFDLVAVSVTQGADSARNKIICDMGDVDGSNVGIPGTADVMLMIGTNDEFNKRNARQFTLAKNKIGGQHDSWPVHIVPQLSRVIDSGD